MTHNPADFYALMSTDRFLHVPTRALWTKANIDGALPLMPMMDEAGEIVRTKAGKPKRQAPSKWLIQNRPIHGQTWAPGEPQLILDKLPTEGGWNPHAGARVFNLYRPPEPIPDTANPDDIGPWLQHLEFLIPDQLERDHLVFYIAHCAQFPAVKRNHAIVLGGAEGIGKDTLLVPLLRAVGPANWQDVSPKHFIESQFNDFARCVVMRINEARDLGDANRFSLYDHMKIYLASPPNMLRVNEKYRGAFYVPNVCACVITTNYKDALYIPDDDRRHFIVWSNRKKEDFAKDYFATLYQWFHDGGDTNVVAYLRGLDLSDFNPAAAPPQTETLITTIQSNRAPEDDELRDALDDLFWPDAITVASVRIHASPSFRDWLKDRKNARAIPHRLEAVGYTVVRNPNAAADGRWRLGPEKHRIYAKNTLTHEQRLNAAQTASTE